MDLNTSSFNLSLDYDPGGSNSNSTEIPPFLSSISTLSLQCVAAYCTLFIISAGGNASVFYSLTRSHSNTARPRSRISFLILHLCIADLIVTFSAMPMEILWRITIQWYGGEFLCKFCQFVRAFGLYLSSMVVIAISLDRYAAIIHPLRLARAADRARLTVGIAWGLAAVCAAPQALIFTVKAHPKYPGFKQCVTEQFLRSDLEQETVYNVFSVSVLYFIPLAFIIYTYCAIVAKIWAKGREAFSVESRKDSGYSVAYSTSIAETEGGIDPEGKNHGQGQNQPKLILRASSGGGVLMARARRKTLRLTCVIVFTFIFCWTPYVVMTLWYMIDRETAKLVDGRLQEGLFLMAVANSVVNPLIYGTYGSSDCRRRKEVPPNLRGFSHRPSLPLSQRSRRSTLPTLVGGAGGSTSNSNTLNSLVLTGNGAVLISQLPAGRITELV